MMRSHILASLLLLPALTSCADEESAQPGKELGPCVQERFCESPLVCSQGVCVHPDQLDGTGGVTHANGDDAPMATSPDGTSGPGDDGPVSGTMGADGGGPDIYCSQGETEACFCGHTADYGPLGVACSESTVGSPARCCSSDGWPEWGGCSCWTQSCRTVSNDTCLCGIGSADPGSGVASCTPNGGVCCRDDGGSSCTCWSSISTCLEGSSPVGSCSVDDLGCGENARVAACN
jgi:hypothetical protein